MRKMISISMLLLLVLGLHGRTRQDVIDSLRHVIESDVLDSVKFYPYTQVIWHYQRSDVPYAVGLTDDLKTLALKYERLDWLFNAYYYYGVIYKNTGELDKAGFYMDSSYYLARTIEDTIKITNASYQLGIISSLKHDYDSALDHLNRADRYFTSLEMPSSVAMTLGAKGSVYRKMKLHQKALSNYFDAIALYEKHADSTGIANMCNNIANIYSELDSIDLALQFYDRQEIINEQTNNTYGLSFVYENRGRLYHRLGQYDQAIASLKRSVDIRRNFGGKDLLAAALLQLGGSYLKTGNLKEASDLVQQSYEISQEYNLAFQLQQSHEMMAKVYAARGNFEDAYMHFIDFQTIKDSLLNEQISEQALRIDALTDQEMVRREQEIALLSTQNDLKDLQIRSRNRTMGVLAAGIFILGILSIIIYRSRQNIKQLNMELSEKQAIITKSLSEKDFLLKEIHHRVKNNLQIISSLLKLQSRSVVDQKAQEALDEGRNRVRSMALIHQNLYQDEGNVTGIQVKKYLSELIDELISAYAVDQKVQVTLAIEEMVLDVDEVVPIGLIINELVTNTLKYAFHKAEIGKIWISMKTLEDQMIKLEVIDNGRGYAINEGATGFGQRLVKSLAAQLDASYEIEHKEGVKITFIIPALKKVA